MRISTRLHRIRERIRRPSWVLGLIGGALTALLLAASQASGAIVIDDFLAGPFTLTHSGAVGSTVTVAQTGLSTGNVIGGDRNVALTRNAGDGSLSAATETSVNPGVAKGSLDFNAGSGGTIGTLVLTYNRNGAGLGGEDLTEVGVNLIIRVTFKESDFSSFLAVTLTDTAAASHTETETVPKGDSAISFPLADFVANSVDTTLIDEIEISLTGAVSGDYTIELVESLVPEPLTMLGMFLGLGSVGAYIRRRRMK